MNMHKTVMVGAVALFSNATLGCTELTLLGISGEQIVGQGNARLEAPHYSALTIAPGESMLPNGHVGDIDGDGLDDLLLAGMHQSGSSGLSVPDMTVYLFYGRAAFPEKLAAGDADATFDTGAMYTVALGDINGDKLADFVLGDATGYELVFGRKERFTGHYAKFTTGLPWGWGEPARPDDFFVPRFYGVHSVGDINGDGAGEISIQLSERNPVDSMTSIKEYLFEGRKDGWPTGTWDSSWAAASFGTDDPANENLSPASYGDLDGDGKSDIIARQGGRFWLFYGRSAGLHGALTPANADAELDTGSPYAYPNIVGDLDGDGTDDLQVNAAAELRVSYGSQVRYSGVVQPPADLTFAGASGTAQAADLDADGLTDLILVAHTAVDSSGPAVPDASVVYQVRGNGARLTGRYQLQAEQQYQPVGYTAPDALAGFAMIDGKSDFDGDGSSDLLLVTLEDVEPDVHGAVYILPGNSRAPD